MASPAIQLQTFWHLGLYRHTCTNTQTLGSGGGGEGKGDERGDRGEGREAEIGREIEEEKGREGGEKRSLCLIHRDLYILYVVSMVQH